MRVAHSAPTNELCNVLRDKGWKVTGATGDEAVYGSCALARADPIPGDNRPAEIISLALGYLGRQWPNEAGYVQAFSDHVRDRVNAEINPPRSARGFGHAIDDRRSYDLLVATDPDAVEEWIQPVLNGAKLHLGHLLFSAEKAIFEVCRALMGAGRPSGAELWRALMRAMADTSVKSDELPIMAFGLPSNDVTREVRREALDRLHLDQRLQDAASALRRHGENADLIDLIDDVLERSTYDCARALVLAGELDNDEAAHALWDARILGLDLPDWLIHVRDVARSRFTANIHAKHWMTVFLTAENRVSQFGAFELFMSTAGRTCGRWATRMMDDARERVDHRTYDQWRINVPVINERLNEEGKAAKDRLAFTRVPKHDQSPWH